MRKKTFATILLTIGSVFMFAGSALAGPPGHGPGPKPGPAGKPVPGPGAKPGHGPGPGHCACAGRPGCKCDDHHGSHMAPPPAPKPHIAPPPPPPPPERHYYTPVAPPPMMSPLHRCINECHIENSHCKSIPGHSYRICDDHARHCENTCHRRY